MKGSQGMKGNEKEKVQTENIWINTDQKEKDEKRIDEGKKTKNDNKIIIRNDKCRE